MPKTINFRPNNFDEFFGQTQIVKEIKVYIFSAKQRKGVLDHLLFYGPGGTGKTTLALLISKELGKQIRVLNAPIIQTIQDLVDILATIEEGEILFIDEIHRLDKKVEEVLYSALEDFKLNIPYKSKENCKIISVNLPKFTMIGATTIDGMITPSLRERFGIKFYFDSYTKEEIAKLVIHNINKLDLAFVKDEIAFDFALRTKLNPRIANNLIKRLDDYCLYKGVKAIDKNLLEEFFLFINIDIYGLNELDKKIIKVMYENFLNQPISIESLSSILNENPITIKEVYEPYLVAIGFINRTRRGRILTKLGQSFYYSNILK